MPYKLKESSTILIYCVERKLCYLSQLSFYSSKHEREPVHLIIFVTFVIFLASSGQKLRSPRI